jgi:hypothetical protein
MHPEMTSCLAGQRRRELSAAADRAQLAATARRSAQFRWSAPVLLPRVRLSWTRTTLALAGDGHGPQRSWVLIISATRAR